MRLNGVTAARAGAAITGGLLLWAGHPPLDWGWVAPVALVPLLMLSRSLRGASLRSAFGWGCAAGAVFFVPLLAWVKPFGFLPWLLLAGLQALTIGLFVVVVAAWGGRRLWPLAAVVAWCALELARMRYPLGGFGWGLLGYTQHDGGVLLPLARVAGVLGVGAVCVAVAVTVVWAWEAARQGRRWWLPVIAAAVGLSGLVVGAALVPLTASTGRSVDIAAVQGNDLQRSGAAGVQRLDTGRIVAVAQAMLEATRPLADDPPQVTVWPENSLDDDPRTGPETGQAASAALELLDGGALIAGALAAGPRPGTAYNVAAEIVPGPAFDEVYAKRQTVPFAEYIPARRWLEWIPPLRQIPIDLLGATSPAVIHAGGAAIGVVICFENVFPHLVADELDAGSEVLVVSTNNASFGRTPMSRQHLAFSQVRAVETGRWVLHAGISGISGVVDPEGVVTQRTALYEEAIVRADLPLVAAPTPYLRLRTVIDVMIAVAGAAVLAVLLLDRRHRRKPETTSHLSSEAPPVPTTSG